MIGETTGNTQSLPDFIIPQEGCIEGTPTYQVEIVDDLGNIETLGTFATKF